MLSFTFQYGSIWRRLAAMVVDTVVLIIIGAVLFDPIVSLLGIHALHETSHRVPFAIDIVRAYGAWLVALIAAAWLYFAIMESSRMQGTLGKRITGLMVFTTDEARLSFREASIRFWAKLLSILTGFFGFFLAIYGTERRALHDRIAGTVVLQSKVINASGSVLSGN
jgi:uncharacterized RDD family membrane protein YckC